MTETDYSILLNKSKHILNNLNKGTLGDGGMGMPVEHQTSEGMGSRMLQHDKSNKLMPPNIEDEKNLSQQKAELYAKLAEDTKFVADRQHKYSEQAMDEKKYSEEDKQKAKEKEQVARMMDDEEESKIDEEFANYRNKVANTFEQQANEFKDLERKHLMNKINVMNRLNKDMDGGPVTNAGFETNPADQKFKRTFVKKPVQQKQPLPEISSEVKLSNSVLDKSTSYESVAGPLSYTDEITPKTDSFYNPTNVNGESNDTKKDAKKHRDKTKELEDKYFGQYDENVGNQGAARAKQQYNTGAFENSQLNQGMDMGKAGGINVSRYPEKDFDVYGRKHEPSAGAKVILIDRKGRKFIKSPSFLQEELVRYPKKREMMDAWQKFMQAAKANSEMDRTFLVDMRTDTFGPAKSNDDEEKLIPPKLTATRDRMRVPSGYQGQSRGTPTVDITQQNPEVTRQSVKNNFKNVNWYNTTNQPDYSDRTEEAWEEYDDKES